MKREPSRIKSDILLRVRLLYVLFILIGATVLVRLVWVQAFSREVAYNAQRLEGRIFNRQVVPAQRGSILSRSGEPLAISIFRYRPMFDFASPGLDSTRVFHEQSDSLAKLLAAFFGDRPAAAYRRLFREEHARRYRVTYRKDTLVPRSEGRIARWIDRFRGREFVTRKLYDTLRDHTPVAVFPRAVDYAEWEQLRRYPLLNGNMGLTYRLEQSDERIYPQGELALRTIGRTGDRGNYGIEAVLREELAGRDGIATRQRIARGFYGRVADAENVEPEDGLDIVTTLETDIQDVADKALRRQMEEQNALWGTTIVMEVATGEVLAMVNLGRDARGNLSERVRNYAIGMTTEPGSTFKLASMLALLDDAGIPLDETYDTNDGRITRVGGIDVRDSHGGYREMDFPTAVAQSSNVWFAEAVWAHYADRKERYGDYLRHLHLDRPVGLERFGEKTPTFDDWKAVPDPNSMLIRRSFGYRIKLAPIQMITLYNAVANGGRMIAPVLIRETRRNGRLEERFRTHTLVDRICSEATLRKEQACLEAVFTRGTGAPYFRDTTRYRAAGKTGTAQYADDRIGYRDGYYVGSMVAYLPADAPRYTVLTTIHTRRQSGKAYYGGPLAGPVTKRVADYLYNREPDGHARLESDGPRRHPRRIKGGSIAEVREVAGELSPRVRSAERKGWGHARTDSLAQVIVEPLDVAPGTMPDVRGMGLKEALFLLESRGLRVSFTGRGAVRQQSIAAGTRIQRGATVQIRLTEQ